MSRFSNMVYALQKERKRVKELEVYIAELEQQIEEMKDHVV